MTNQYKRTAYLAPELPSLSATFVTNEIWALEDLGVEVHPFSVHPPKHPAHGSRAAELAARTPVLYSQTFLAACFALLWNAFYHKRSTLKALFRLGSDIVKSGIISKTAFKLIYQFLRSAWLAREMRVRNIEHLHIHFAHVPTQIGMYASALAGVPYTFMTHANDLFERPLLIKEKIDRALQAISISNFNVDIMEQKKGDRSKISIVRCGVETTPEYASSQLMLDRGFYLIGTLGRLVEKKGVDTLISAAKQLKEKGIPVRIEIAGDGPLRKKLVEQVKDCELSDSVVFLGAMPHYQVLKWMRSLDAFVLAGKKDINGDMDGIPVVLMEAMERGVPVLSTRLSGIPELVIHDKTGLLSNPDDPEGLSKNLADLYQNQNLANRLASEAKLFIREEFDRKLNAKRLLTIINTPQEQVQRTMAA